MLFRLNSGEVDVIKNGVIRSANMTLVNPLYLSSFNSEDTCEAGVLSRLYDAVHPLYIHGPSRDGV